MGRTRRQRRVAGDGRQRAGRRPPHARQHPDIATVLRAAVDAWGRDPQAHDTALEQLVRRAAAGAPVAQTAMRSIDDALDRLWQRGWTPTDLVDVTARRLSDAHRTIVAHAVVVDGRRRAASGAPPHGRWQAQLDALSDSLPEGPIERSVVDVRLLVPTLALVQRLPAIPAVMPGPDAASGVAPAAARMDERMLARVRGLLAKAESTSFDEEAQALTAKAQELITRHAIADALAHTEDDVGEPSIRRVGVATPYPDAKAALLSVVADANRCEAVHAPDMGWVTLVGFDGDLDAVELLGASLLAQATGAMASQGSRRDRHGRSTTRSFRRAFLYGYATRIGERLRQAAGRQVHDEADRDGLLPVLAARDARVADTVATAFPALERRSTSLSNATGWVSGRTAADVADLTAHHRPVGNGVG